MRKNAHSVVGALAVVLLLVIPCHADEAAVTAEVTAMCERLLANPVIEDYTVEVVA